MNCLCYVAITLVDVVVRLSALTDNIFIKKTLINVHILICDSLPPEKYLGLIREILYICTDVLWNKAQIF